MKLIITIVDVSAQRAVLVTRFLSGFFFLIILLLPFIASALHLKELRISINFSNWEMFVFIETFVEVFVSII